MSDVQRDLGRLVRGIHLLRTETQFLRLHLILKAGFRPDQPRVPAGSSEGGQWTDGGVVRVSRRTSGSSGPIRVGNRWLNPTPAQEVRLARSFAEMRAALRDVRKVDPGWKPTPQLYETVEGQIAANSAIALQAQFRVFELRGTPVGPGPFAREWIPAPATNRRLTKGEQNEINRIGRLFGCHRCGVKVPGTFSQNFIGDHQWPRALGVPIRIYPHCWSCSNTQGGLVNWLKYRSEK